MSSLDVLGILPAERFECNICQEVFSDPVTTPCGHTFCKACIGEHWDSSETCQCPKCNKRFHARPEVSTNSLVEEIVTQIKRRKVEVKEEAESPPTHAQEEVTCDLCVGRRLRAVKSCLVCVASMCETHLKPHHSVAALRRHQLVEPLANIEEKICQKHQRMLELYCRDEEMCICLLCSDTDHKEHHMVPLEEEAPRQTEKVKRTRAEIQTMIRERKEKMEEVRVNVELSREKTKKDVEDVDELFGALMERVRGKHTELKATMEGKQRETENMANTMVEHMELEITELQEKSNELEELGENLHIHIHLLQTAKKLCSHHPTTTAWSERSLYSDVCINTVREALAHLVHAFSQELKTLTDMESVSMDPDTANRWLTLSEGGKRVKSSCRPNPASEEDNPERFDRYPMVIGEKGFTSGRHYWEVQVGVRTDWDVGIAKETVNRKSEVNVDREHGFFSMGRTGLDYICNDTSRKTLLLHPQLRKVGVYLDYEEGRVSFYDVDEKTHIYSMMGETFTEKMFPYFYVYSKKNKSEALLITYIGDIRAYYRSLLEGALRPPATSSS